MELGMAKDNIRLEKVLQDMSYAINHIEDMVADNRAIIVKLVKQNNQIVEFLKQIEIEDITDTYSTEAQIPTVDDNELSYERVKKIKALLDEFMGKSSELKEFEEELQKHKDELTPGTIGES